MKPAVFFDRDGVLNRAVERDGRAFAPLQENEFFVMPDAKEAVDAVHRAGFLAIVVTNQPEIASGKITWQTLNRLHALLIDSTGVDHIYVCPHDKKDNCDCHKPKPGLIYQAASEWNVDLTASFLIGDRWRDIGAGRAAGCYTILIERPYSNTTEANFNARDLISAVDHVLITRLNNQPTK